MAIPIFSLNVLKRVPAEYADERTSMVDVAMREDIVEVAAMYPLSA